MVQARYTFNFCIKKTRLATDGKAPIYLRVTIDADRKEKATNLFVYPGDWEPRFGLCIGKDKYSLSLNERLTVIRTKMLEAYTALSLLGGVPSAEDVINKFMGKEPEKEVEVKHYLIPLFQEHNDRCEKLAANGQMAPGTVIRYKTSLNHTRDFIRYKFNTEDVELCKIDRNFLDDYNEYLKEIAEVCHIEKDISTHSARHTFATLALNNGVALQNVAKMLGHSNIKMTQRYARVLDRSIKRDMEGLQTAISNLGFV